MRRLLLQKLEFHLYKANASTLRSLPSTQLLLARTYPHINPFKHNHRLKLLGRRNISPQHTFYQKSLSPYLVLFTLIISTSLIVDYVANETVSHAQKVEEAEKAEKVDLLANSAHETDEEFSQDSFSAFFAAMPLPQGFLGNLNSDQEQKLREFWAVVLKTFGVNDPLTEANGSSARPITPADAPAASADESSAKKKERHGLFHRKHKDSVGSESPGSPGKQDPEDKYGQTREFADILANTQPETLREAFWSMVKKDHPDALLLRFLRARKWDSQRALAMLISTMHWRKNEMHVDDDIMIQGEGGALKDSHSSNASVKKEGNDFLAQLRLGKSFIHGIDKDGRPICFVRVRLHKSGEQTERALERYTVYVIETARLALQSPVETATIVFDMTNFTMANMDYSPVKFMIKVFEANYPESLGCVLVHKAPWIFQGIWKIIRGWLDPVVAAKVHFTNGVEDLSNFIPKSQIIKELGGDENWEYKYIEPIADENKTMEETSKRDEIEAARKQDVLDYERKTFEWIHGQDKKDERDEIASRLRRNYWQLDPYIRARTLYDRTGMIKPDGTVNFYPTQTVKTDNLPSLIGEQPPPKVQASADDVD